MKWKFWQKDDGDIKESLSPELLDYVKKAPQGDDSGNAANDGLSPPKKPIISTQVGQGRMQKSLHQIAMDNCVEYEKAFSDCLLRGSYWDRFNSCQSQKAMQDQCVNLQSMALNVLHYDEAASDEERAHIKAKADDIMIEHIPKLVITEPMVASFTEALKKLQ